MTDPFRLDPIDDARDPIFSGVYLIKREPTPKQRRKLTLPELVALAACSCLAAFVSGRRGV